MYWTYIYICVCIYNGCFDAILFMEKTGSHKTRQVYKTFYWQQNNREETSPLPIPQECLHLTVSLLKAYFHGNKQQEGMELSAILRKMFQCSVKGLTVCKCAAGPVTTQTWQATVYAEPAGTNTKQAEGSDDLYYFWGQHVKCCHLYSVSGDGNFSHHCFCFAILKDVYTSNWRALSQRTPDALHLTTYYQFMHALEFTLRRLHWHKGKKISAA